MAAWPNSPPSARVERTLVYLRGWVVLVVSVRLFLIGIVVLTIAALAFLIASAA